MTDGQNRPAALLEKYTRSEINETEFEELCDHIKEPENDST